MKTYIIILVIFLILIGLLGYYARGGVEAVKYVYINPDYNDTTILQLTAEAEVRISFYLSLAKEDCIDSHCFMYLTNLENGEIIFLSMEPHSDTFIKGITTRAYNNHPWMTYISPGKYLLTVHCKSNRIITKSKRLEIVSFCTWKNISKYKREQKKSVEVIELNLNP